MWYKLNKDKTVEKLPGDTYPTDSFFESEDHVVGKDIIDGQLISTVFLALDHSWNGGPPLLFETMIFDGPHDQYMKRYSTYDEALKGHNKIVEVLKLNLNPNIVLP